MRRRLGPGRLVLATHNPGKLAELRTMLAPFAIEVVPAGALGLAEPEETEASFEGNARLKALAAANASGLPALADDSGLACDGLDGAPGVLSARWAGPERDFRAAMARVRDALTARYGRFEDADRRARFVSVLCLAWPDGHAELFRGEVEGTLLAEPRGTGGFGYDPIFVPAGEARSFGEMAAAEKHAISHRARALEQLVATCLPAR